MITYTWEITAKPTTPLVKNYENVVVAVIWKLIGTLGNSKQETVGTTFFHSPSEGFIPYEDLTDEVLISWITSKEDMTTIYGYIESRLNKVANIQE